MQKIDENFEGLNYLLEFKRKNEDLDFFKKQELHLHIAYFYLERSEIENAIKFFLKALVLNPRELRVIYYFILL